MADHVLDPSKGDVPARVRELTGGTGADVAFEYVGVNAVLDFPVFAATRLGQESSCTPTRSSRQRGRDQSCQRNRFIFVCTVYLNLINLAKACKMTLWIP